MLGVCRGSASVSSLEDRMSKLGEGVARIEGVVERMDKRLNHIETGSYLPRTT
jgi:hypothetical protein